MQCYRSGFLTWRLRTGCAPNPAISEKILVIVAWLRLFMTSQKMRLGKYMSRQSLDLDLVFVDYLLG